jgi:hypothetical protein
LLDDRHSSGNSPPNGDGGICSDARFTTSHVELAGEKLKRSLLNLCADAFALGCEEDGIMQFRPSSECADALWHAARVYDACRSRERVRGHLMKHRAKVGYWALLDLMLGFGYDARLLALDGPCGGLPPDMKLDEWVELYRTLNAVRYATPPAHV